MTAAQSTELEESIATVLRRPGGEWRTAGGLSRELGVAEDEVRRAIEAREDIFMRAPVSPSGIPTYCLVGNEGAA